MGKKPVNDSLAVIKAIKEFAHKNAGRPPEQFELEQLGAKEWQIRKMGGLHKAWRSAGIEVLDSPRKFQEIADRLKAAKEELQAVKAENSELKDLPHVKNSLALEKAKREIQDYRKQVRDLSGEAISAQRLRELIGSVDCDQMGGGSDWTLGNSKSHKTTGIPVLNLSDLHFDEVVKREQVGGKNEYNHDIAVARIKNCVKYAISLLKYHMVNPKYDGIILNLIGDLLSGNIHEELTETNEQPINKSIFDLTDLLITVIGMLADEFGRVFIPCVTGNHGRMHRKPRAKNRVKDNFEWIIYQCLSRYFKNDSRVSFLIPESSDAYFSVYGYRFLSTHGDQFKGGDGVTGCLSAIMRGFSKKQSKQQAMSEPFDFMTIGHFHQLTWYKGIFINSTTKGMDEWTYQQNFGYEPAQQGLFIMHPEWGMVGRWPIFCDLEAPTKSRKPIEIFA